jgi:DNA-binding MarR family transcriptional regulator
VNRWLLRKRIKGKQVAPLNHHRRLELATRVLEDLRRIFQSIRLSARRAERELGVSGAQLFVLQALAERPAESLNDMAERTLTHQSSVSVVVRRLVQRGLVARDRAGDDARRIVLRLTPAGRRLLRRAPVTPQVKMVETIQALRDGDLHLIARLMHQLAKAVHATRLEPQLMFAEAEVGRAPRRGRRAPKTAVPKRTRGAAR